MTHAFDEKVKAMKASEILLAMTNALEAPRFCVDMDVVVRVEAGKVYGCSGTHTISRISGLVLTANNSLIRWAVLDASNRFMYTLETALEYLRRGLVTKYNTAAKHIGIATIPEKYEGLFPRLENDTWKEQLGTLKALSKELQSEGL